MESFFHSVKLDSGLCVGCTNCVKRCPTAAIRVQDGKAHILRELCFKRVRFVNPETLIILPKREGRASSCLPLLL